MEENVKKISELPEADTIFDGCCMPIVQEGETKKIYYSNMKIQLKEDIGEPFSGDYNDLKNKPQIPSRMSELRNDVGYLTGNLNVYAKKTELEELEKELESFLIRGTARGESISVNDSANYKAKLNIEGNNKQETRSGKNLFNIESSFRTTGSDYINIKSGNGFYFELPSYRRMYIYIDNGKALKEGTYKISFDVLENTAEKTIGFSIRTDSTSEASISIDAGFLGRRSATVNLTSGTTNSIYLYLSSSDVNGAKLNIQNIQIEEGSTATSYEQYGASPSPEYPSEVETVGKTGNVTVEVSNKNEFNNTIEQGSFDSSGNTTSSTTRVRSSDFVEINSNAQKTISAISTKALQCIIYEYDKNKSYIGQISSSWHTLPYTFTPTAKYIKFVIRFSDNANVTPADISDVQIEEGTTATPYQPHKSETYTLPIQKEMLEGDSFEKIGGVWKEKHSWGKKALNDIGLADWRAPRSNENNIVFCNLVNTNVYNFISDNAEQYSDYFNFGGRGDGGYSGALLKGVGMYAFIDGGHHYMYFVVSKNIASDVNEWVQWLAANKPVVYYKLAETEYIDCTPEQVTVLEQLSKIKTYKNVTHVNNDSIAVMDLAYFKDLETLLNNL